MRREYTEREDVRDIFMNMLQIMALSRRVKTELEIQRGGGERGSEGDGEDYQATKRKKTHDGPEAEHSVGRGEKGMRGDEKVEQVGGLKEDNWSVYVCEMGKRE